MKSLLPQYRKSTTSIVFDIDHIVDMFSEFANDMMANGQVIFSEHTIKNHSVFKHKWNEEEIDWSEMLSFPFIVQRGKWYEFQTLAFQAYLSLKHFLKQKEEGNTVFYTDFLKLRGAFLNIEHDIWLLCSELDLQHFNQSYLIPILKKYVNAVDATNPRTLCASTLRVLELTLNFRISEDTYFPDASGSCCDGLVSTALEFIGHDLLDIELHMNCSEVGDESKRSKLLCLGQLIIQADSLGYNKDEYVLDLVEHGSNPELLEILEALGVCEFLWRSYYQVLRLVEKAVSNNYTSRLDSYSEDPKVRRFVTTD
ncbi:hypothetical protein [Paenibacillus sp. FSL H7-0331]|uniref:hypothetical protein n=1 Tax=Paenibacillus sp. FSL H7-0331 TaxID=1920421 RepID=UPI00096F9635|nr:hypothetical protein [Paenibacillus sp. FSL H7-0331]OMF09192.1 hypothetical protein BK127_26865 [Paenibacillus sp. FSL H7-0331]